MTEAQERQSVTPGDEAQDHWLKVLFRRLPLGVRLAFVAAVALVLIALPLLILFRSLETQDSAGPAPAPAPIEQLAPTPTTNF